MKIKLFTSGPPKWPRDQILDTWQLSLIYKRLQHPTVTCSHFFCGFLATPHYLSDTADSDLHPYDLLNDRGDNNHHKNGHKIKSDQLTTATIYD